MKVRKHVLLNGCIMGNETTLTSSLIGNVRKEKKKLMKEIKVLILTLRYPQQMKTQIITLTLKSFVN